MTAFLRVSLTLWLVSSSNCFAQQNEAVDKAISLVKGNVQSLKADEFILLDYVGRRFGIEIVDRKTTEQFIEQCFGADSAETLLFQFRSLVTHSEQLVDIGKASHPIDSVSLLALSCADAFDETHFIAKLKRHRLKGGYYLTHALASYQWAIEQGCISESDSDVKQLKSELQESNFEFATRSTAPPDERFEAICMLYYTGYDPVALNAFKKEVLKAQLPDGGWSSADRSEETSFHTTAFALWILLENEFGTTVQHPKWVLD
ncbi:MAG: hypothetical protein EP314_00600 [Bacteroidetes bacterium]|nr:MAG: hypothetical protein EP314_00600 [Bacteroidota bacterium]